MRSPSRKPPPPTSRPSSRRSRRSWNASPPASVSLEDRLAEEEAAAAAAANNTRGAGGGSNGGEGGGAPPPVTGTGWIQTCPVNGPNSFVDSFGDPRPGGRSHAGIDMIAARGTPVVAVHSGTVHRTGSLDRRARRRGLPRRQFRLDLLHPLRPVRRVRRGLARLGGQHDRLRREHGHDRLSPALRIPPGRGQRSTPTPRSSASAETGG